MHALVATRFAPVPEGLNMVRRALPQPGAGEVVLRVEAAALNPHDLKLIEGKLPHERAHLPLVPASDVAGVVVAGSGGFSPGDRVFGIAHGALATYASARASDIAPLPRGLGFESAASLPVAGMTVLQAFRAVGGVRAGMRVLVQAGAGGVGSLAIQIAHAAGAEVWTTARTRHHSMLAALGATGLIDYRHEDVDTALSAVDMVLDTLGGAATMQALTHMRPGSTLSAIAPAQLTGQVARALGLPLPVQAYLALKPNRLRRLARARKLRYAFTLMRPDGADLTTLSALVQAGALRPVVGRVFSFAQSAQALHYLAHEHAPGKVVVSMRTRSEHPLAP